MFIPYWRIVILIVIVFIVIKKLKKNDLIPVEDQISKKVDIITEESIFKIQDKFENKLKQTYLPDAITRKYIYIFKNLMCPWFNQLSSRYRYDDVVTQKLRSDWLNYMEALKDSDTYNYLSLEAEKQEDEERYRNNHIIASKKALAIEDAFASEVWSVAKEELARVKSLDFYSFNINGEIAPDGFEFDLSENIRKKV